MVQVASWRKRVGYSQGATWTTSSSRPPHWFSWNHCLMCFYCTYLGQHFLLKKFFTEAESFSDDCLETCFSCNNINKNKLKKLYKNALSFFFTPYLLSDLTLSHENSTNEVVDGCQASDICCLWLKVEVWTLFFFICNF